MLQTRSAEDPQVLKGEDVMLFLEKYTGPVTSDAYVCKGLYQGNYKLGAGTVTPSKDDGSALAEQMKSLGTVAKISEKIAAAK